MRLEHRPVDRRNPKSLIFEPYRRNVTSQNGEDGVIARLFELLGTTNRTCIEFGAADGKLSSNTWSLIHQSDWRGILIEGNPTSFAQLRQTYGSNPKTSLINRYVDLGANSLDTLLKEVDCPLEPDFLSIDIDGQDWQIWRSLTAYRPRAIVIEFNPTVPNDIVLVPGDGPTDRQGCSLLSLVELGRKKGYELAATTEWNAFFVAAELFSRLGIEDNSIDAIHSSEPYETKMLQLFDGTLLLVGNDKLMWREGSIRLSVALSFRSRWRAILRSARNLFRR